MITQQYLLEGEMDVNCMSNDSHSFFFVQCYHDFDISFQLYYIFFIKIMQMILSKKQKLIQERKR